MADVAQTALAPVVPIHSRPGFERYVAREPVGVVFTIAPWNCPYHDRELARARVDRGQRRAAQTGRADIACWRPLPEGVRHHRPAQGPLHPHRAGAQPGRSHHLGGQVDHVAFTGSVERGARIERAAAGTFTTLGLELGGKDPAVAADANLKFAIENLVDGAFFNSRQCRAALSASMSMNFATTRS